MRDSGGYAPRSARIHARQPRCGTGISYREHSLPRPRPDKPSRLATCTMGSDHVLGGFVDADPTHLGWPSRDPRVWSEGISEFAGSLTTADGLSFRERCNVVMVPARSTAVDAVPQNCPCQLPKPGLQSQQQPSRSIEEVIETRGFARKNGDGRNADRRLANRYTGRFQAVSSAGLTPVGISSREQQRRLYWKSP